MSIICLEIGDPSWDGHKMCKNMFLEISCSVDDFRAAFKKSHETLGFQIACIRGGREYPDELQLCTEYDDNVISPEIVQVLKELNCPLVRKYKFSLKGANDGRNYIEPEIFVEIPLWYVRQSLDFTGTVVELPVLGDDGTGSMGYGLYSG